MSARTSKSLKAKESFARHPVFTHAEFVEAHTRGGRSRHTSDALLAQHVGSGRLVRVRRGVYATVERGQDPRTATPDPYLVATKLRPDAVVVHHAALALQGKAYSVWTRYHYLTAEHPALRWKALNVRKGFGGATRDDLEGREAPGPEH